MAKQTKPAKCPYCRQEGTKNSSGHIVHSPDYNFHRCRLIKVVMLLDQWNALGADIERGRNPLFTFDDYNQRILENSKLTERLDMVVRLLRRWRRAYPATLERIKRDTDGILKATTDWKLNDQLKAAYDDLLYDNHQLEVDKIALHKRIEELRKERNAMELLLMKPKADDIS